jgi:hypothetical protein
MAARSQPFAPLVSTSPNRNSQLRIVVLGYIVRGPIGGMAWHHLQYVLGLKLLGHDVLFLEDSDDYASCYDPSTHQVGTDATYGLAFAQHAFERLGLGDQWTYYDAHSAAWLGPAASRAVQFSKDADVLLNVSGVNPVRHWVANIPVRIYIDTDPVFTQVRHLTSDRSLSQAKQHNVFFTFAELVSHPACNVPFDGFDWQATRQPVVLDAWSQQAPPENGALTTVMQWDSYPALEYGGRRFGMKSDSFRKFQELPGRVSAELEIALGGNSAPRVELAKSGWRLIDPLVVTRDPWTYQDYISRSRGEFSVAKQGYVASKSGWFSERTTCYLAAGRPAIVEDTGFSLVFPCGLGLLPFHSLDTAIYAIDHLQSNYRNHCEAARELAKGYFDSAVVLTSLLERAFSTQRHSLEVRS